MNFKNLQNAVNFMILDQKELLRKFCHKEKTDTFVRLKILKPILMLKYQCHRKHLNVQKHIWSKQEKKEDI